MTQHSEDRIADAAPEPTERGSAQILPFERRSELQRAIQQRAQEALDIERDRDREANKPAPLRWAIILLIAMVPVVLLFSAVDAFLRVFHKVNEMNAAQPAPAVVQEEAPAEPTPGVIMLEPLDQRGAPDSAAPAEPARPRQ